MNLFDLCVYKNLNKGSGGDVDVSSLVATENKTYNAGEGKAYNPVVVNVPTPSPSLNSITINENGHFTPPAGTDGYDDITVYVPYVTQGTTINENGTYTPPSGVDGFGRVIVDVPLPNNAYLLESQKDDVVTIQNGAEFDMPKLIASIEPQQSGSGDPSPENVRPISGWTACNVVRCGKNLYDKEGIIADMAYASNSNTYKTITYISTYFIEVKEGTTLTISGMKNWGTSAINCFVDGYQGNYISTVGSRTGSGGIASNVTVTVPSGAKYLAIACYTGTSDYEQFQDKDTIQVELGSSATTYEEYNGDTYTINFVDGSNPLTVYGGTLNVLSGLLTITDGYISSYNGETLPSTWISDRDVYAEGTTPTTGAEVCYELATPQTYQLTPTEVKSLLGVNNIFADTGEVDVQIWTKEVTS